MELWKPTNDNPVRAVASDCNTALQNLCILFEKILYPILHKLPSKIRDTNDM